jgi:hypothetical protein
MPALSTQLRFNINSGTYTTSSVVIPSAAVAPDNSSNFYSLPEKGDGFYGSADGVHTITYTVTPNFSGNIYTQATLATNPTESDWFPVVNTTATYIVPNIPLTTTTNYFNFTGNFVWIRAVVLRNAVQPNGTLLFVNYNH